MPHHLWLVRRQELPIGCCPRWRPAAVGHHTRRLTLLVSFLIGRSRPAAGGAIGTRMREASVTQPPPLLLKLMRRIGKAKASAIEDDKAAGLSLSLVR